MPQIIPIKELKNISEISGLCQKNRIWRYGNHEYWKVWINFEKTWNVPRYCDFWITNWYWRDKRCKTRRSRNEKEVWFMIGLLLVFNGLSNV